MGASAVYKVGKPGAAVEFRGAGNFLARSAAHAIKDKAVFPPHVLKLFALLVHQISQPLTVLVGEIEMALRLPECGKPLRAALERCSSNLELTTRLVGDFRTLSEMGPAVIRTTPLAALITQVVEATAGSAEAAGHQLKWRPRKEFYLRTDSEILQKALSKLIAEAAGDCLPGGTLEISLANATDAARLTFSYPERESAAAKAKRPAPRIQGPSMFSRLPETSPDVALSKTMIEALGGSLEVLRPSGSERRTRIQIT
ncbi:MAG: hypothetical protein ACRD3O_11660, partial [Terriglobia bacterium]